MPSIRIWTPESDFDSKAVRCIAEKIVAFYGSDIKILEASKMAYNQAFQKNQKDGLQKQVNIYLKTSDLVIFLIDYDGIQSYAQRSKEPNSLVNRITEVVNSIDKAILVYIKQEVESWLLVDCLGICCYFTKDESTRIKKDWIEDEFKSLSLFSDSESFFIHQANDLNAELIDCFSSIQITDRFVILSFENDQTSWKKVVKEEKIQAITIEAPKFWETNKLLDFCCHYLKLRLSHDSRTWILEVLENNLPTFYNAAFSYESLLSSFFVLKAFRFVFF
jgi:hypothetical protein